MSSTSAGGGQHPRHVRRIDRPAWLAGLTFRQDCANCADGKKEQERKPVSRVHQVSSAALADPIDRR